jgi:thioredoxin reductase
MQQRVFDNPKIEVIYNATVEEIHGDETTGKLKSVLLKDVVTNDTKVLPVQGTNENVDDVVDRRRPAISVFWIHSIVFL